MFNSPKRIDGLVDKNRLLIGVIVLFFISNLFLIFQLSDVPRKQTFWLSSNAILEGGEISANKIPEEYVYSFASTFMPLLTTWKKGGGADMRKLINDYSYYLTPRHRTLLLQLVDKSQKIHLFEREQTSSLFRFMEEGDVKKVSPNVWSVHLVLRATQRLDNTTNYLVADKIVDYKVRVVRSEAGLSHNPFGLAIDGYVEKERLTKDVLVEKEVPNA